MYNIGFSMNQRVEVEYKINRLTGDLRHSWYLQALRCNLPVLTAHLPIRAFVRNNAEFVV
jgi:hypothetical protein